MDFSLTTLYVLPSGNLAPDGFRRENLQKTQFGIFNSRYRAVTTAGEAVKSPYIQFGQGRIENVPGLTDKYSDKFSRGSLIEWYKTNGSADIKNQITYAGFDGVDNTKTMRVSCDEEYSLTIRARSFYLDTVSAYGLTRTVTVKTPCCEDCGDNCEVIDPRWLATEFARKINEEAWLSRIVVATPVFECTVPPDVPVVVDVVTYCLNVCDNGDSGAQAAIQAQYPLDIVEFGERVGSITTYRLTRLASAGAPANAIITLPVRLSECDTCPATYTLQPVQDQYIIETPLDGSEVLVTPANQQTFANTIGALYQPAEVFDGATGVDPATNQITVTAHGWSVGQAVVYSNGGGTTVVGLTNGATYYIQSVPTVNTVTLSATKGGAVVDITADGVGAAHSLTPVFVATFLENTGGSARIALRVDSLYPALVALTADIVTANGELEALCLPPAGTSVAWASCDTGFQVQRSLRLTITNDCASDLASVQAQYPSLTITLVESANCNSLYNAVQTSETIQEDCEFSVPPKFTDVQPYKGIEWIVVPENLTGSDCVAGVKIEGKPLDKYGNPCNPISWPYLYDKLTFEVFAYKAPATSQDFNTYDRCDNIPITTTQKSSYITGSGDEIYELEKRYFSYQTTMKHIYFNTDYNGAFVRYSDPGKFYDTYVLKFKSPDLLTWDASTRQDESVIIAVPTGEGIAIENFLVGFFGVEKFTAGVLSQSL